MYRLGRTPTLGVMVTPEPHVLACVEVGGSGAQTVVFEGSSFQIRAGVDVPCGASLALAVPGLIENGRVVHASSIGWNDVDPASALLLPQRPLLVLNDAEAAALGEWTLRPGCARLLYVGLGTGIGGAVVENGRVIACNLLGHAGGFGDAECLCGKSGCLETLAAGWALPRPVPTSQLAGIASAIAGAVTREPAARDAMVVVAGGLVDSCPSLVGLVAGELAGWQLFTTLRPDGAKSAAAWGLRWAVASVAERQPQGGRDGDTRDPRTIDRPYEGDDDVLSAGY